MIRNLNFLFFFILFFSGCATITTVMWPEVEKEIIGEERILDDKVGYEYKVDISDKNFNVKAIPFCREKAPKYRMTKKQHHGIVFIIIETPLWGLGLADWLLSYSVSKSSEKKEFIAYVPTGIKKECKGKVESVQVEVMIQNSVTGEIKWIKTDEKGNFSLFSSLGNYNGDKLYNLFIKTEDGTIYLTSVWW